ncbi:Radial spoke head protein 9 like protein [Chelonia mydas]|uniref:Radial spoke head protein 9 homolog n=1 Tax=Chelonia mydas TaxID=8469 RepID=M7AHL6_CHEMY|nr:Radial spoke head protein 9 like protein [Chelonia mydas]
MDAESLTYALDLVAGGGGGLSSEKRAALRASLLLLRRDYRFEQVRFWGRIQGIRGPYYIAEGLGGDRAGPRSPLPSLNCVEWSLLPPATEEMITQTAGLKGRFQGDPSYEYDPTEKKGEENERIYEEEGGPMIKEEIRLVATIDQIDKAVGIVPRGAFVKTPLGPVHENRNFEGVPKLGSRLVQGKPLADRETLCLPEHLLVRLLAAPSGHGSPFLANGSCRKWWPGTRRFPQLSLAKNSKPWLALGVASGRTCGCSGLSLTEAKKLNSYFHFTEPVNLKNRTLLQKADLDPSIDFLDSLEHDIPTGRLNWIALKSDVLHGDEG